MPQTFNVGSRSAFVTLTAWLFIVVASLASASALVQNAQVAANLPLWRAGIASLPPVTGWLLHYLPWLVGVGVVASLALLVCAVGLLLRMEWARRTAIALLALAIVGNLAGLWVQHEVVHALVQATLTRGALPAQAAGVFGGMATAAQVMAVLVTLAACVALAWLIRRLMSDAVRQEFC